MQVISGMERVREGISQALQEQKKAVSEWKPQLGDMQHLLQLIMSLQPTFIIVDTGDECTAIQRFRLLNLLKEVLEISWAG